MSYDKADHRGGWVRVLRGTQALADKKAFEFEMKTRPRSSHTRAGDGQYFISRSLCSFSMFNSQSRTRSNIVASFSLPPRTNVSSHIIVDVFAVHIHTAIVLILEACNSIFAAVFPPRSIDLISNRGEQ